MELFSDLRILVGVYAAHRNCCMLIFIGMGKNMKGLVIYGSTTNNTRQVVARLPKQLSFPVDVVEISTIQDVNLLDQYDLLIFLASTWGDAELQVDMEAFFVRQSISLNGKPFAICELGNYYGYEDFDFGALRIMEHYLQVWEGRELIEPFSMDSLPRKDWINLARWCELLNRNAMELQ